MNNNDNELVRWAMEKIRCDEKHRPDCCVVVGPTGPTGPASGPTGPTGPTERLFKSSNKIIIDSS